MSDILKVITVYRIPKYPISEGEISKSIPKTSQKIRLSVFFDSENDNHHAEFAEDAPREVVVKALIMLAERIRNKGTHEK